MKNGIMRLGKAITKILIKSLSIVGTFGLFFLTLATEIVYLLYEDVVHYPNIILFAFLAMTLVLLTGIKSRVVRLITALMWPTTLFIYAGNLLYIMYRHKTLDLNFFLSNKSAIIPTFVVLFGRSAAFHIILILVFTVVSTYVFLSSFSFEKNKKLSLLTLFVSLYIIIFYPSTNALTKYVDFNILRKSKMSSMYSEAYESYIEKKATATPHFDEEKALTGVYDTNMIILQLESLNSLYVNEEVTPVMLEAAKKGVYFKNGFAHTVQTIRSQEVYFCGLPPSLDEQIVFKYPPEKIDKFHCLPKILSGMGYKNYAFFIANKSFSGHDAFAKQIGFDEVLYKEIMKEGDPRLIWGYREDVFYQRIIQFLENIKEREKFFVLINSGTVNHLPYDSLSDPSVSGLDFPADLDSDLMTDKIKNGTFLQDHYLNIFLEYYFDELYKDTNLIILSDTSYPIGLHQDNLVNESGIYEENFIIPVVFIPAENLDYFKTGLKPNERITQLDIYETILDFYGVDGDYKSLSLGESLRGLLLEDKELEKNRPDFYLQPFGGGGIGIIDYPTKYAYYLKENKLEIYDLSEDPNEFVPKVVEVPYLGIFKTMLDKALGLN